MTGGIVCHRFAAYHPRQTFPFEIAWSAALQWLEMGNGCLHLRPLWTNTIIFYLPLLLGVHVSLDVVMSFKLHAQCATLFTTVNLRNGTEELVWQAWHLFIFEGLSVNLSFNMSFCTPVTFVAHKHSAVLFFMPSCYGNSLVRKLSRTAYECSSL